MSKIKTTFNTRRGYSDEGQIIKIVAIGTIAHFDDITRNITGKVDLWVASDNESVLQRIVLLAYDDGDYVECGRSDFEKVWG